MEYGQLTVGEYSERDGVDSLTSQEKVISLSASQDQYVRYRTSLPVACRHGDSEYRRGRYRRDKQAKLPWPERSLLSL